MRGRGCCDEGLKSSAKLLLEAERVTGNYAFEANRDLSRVGHTRNVVVSTVEELRRYRGPDAAFVEVIWFQRVCSEMG